MRVPVPVASADADHGGVRRYRGQERRVGGGRTVVGHHQHVGGEPVGHAGEQIGLGGALDVTGDQQHRVPVGDPHHVGRLVELAARETVGPSRRRMQHLKVQVPEPQRVARTRGVHRHAAVGRDLPQRGEFGQLRRDVGVGPHRGDPQPSQHRGHPADVIEVGVADHREIEPSTPVRAQPAGGGVVGTGIDEHAGTRGFDEQRVALPDVDGREREPGRRTAAQQARDGRQGQGHRERGREASGCDRPTAREQPPAPEQQREDGQGASERGGTAEALRAVGDRQHDRGGRAGQREHHAGESGTDQRDGGAEESQRGRERRHRHRQQVGGHRGEHDLAEVPQQQRHHRDLRAEGQGQQLPGPLWQPGWEPLSDPRGDHQHPERGAR
jgi:hypothetical protein